MVKAVFASLFGVAAAGGKLALTWEDCGSASTHGKTADLQPSEIVIGEDTQIVGTGTTDKAISSGSFSMKLTASMGIKETYEGKICEAKEFKMPLGIGTVSWAGMDCPVAVGASTVKVGVHMASLLPAALAKADLALTALDQDGESAVCVNTHLVKEQSLASDIDCSKATCQEACTCSLDKCASQIDECMSAPNCASSQNCALACACGDTACTLKCAAASPSIKALPAAKCINSNCNIPPALKSADTCSLYEIADGSCGQSDLNCDYVKYAKAAEKGLADGTCADHGYSVKTGTQTKTYPIIGDIVVTTYSQGLASDIDCSKATCQEACTCSLDKCASQIDECMSAPNCASSQNCALACACGDTACTLKCAAASPSIKALPAAKCINSNCNIPPAVKLSGVHVPHGLIVDLTPKEMEVEMALNEQYERESIEGNYVGPENINFGSSFKACNQKCSNWCWATGATMAASAFTSVSCNSDEESVAEYIYGTPCSTSCPSNCNQGGTTANIASGVKHLSGHSYSSGGVLSQGSLDSALQHGPVVVGVQWSIGGGHAITIHGKSGGKYQIHDPENEENTVEYSGITTYKPNYASGSYTGKWFGSAYTNSGSSLEVKVV